MKKKVFNSRLLYIANILYISILLIITTLGLYLMMYKKDGSLVSESQSLGIIFYLGYFVIYIIALIVLVLRIKSTIKFLNIIFSCAIALNVFDGATNFSKYDGYLYKFFILTITGLWLMGFSLLLFFNNRKKSIVIFTELDEIGITQD